MLDHLILLGALILALAPGAGLALLAGVRSPLLVLAVAPATTIGLLVLAACGFAAAGLPFGPVGVGVLTLLLVAGGIVRWWRRADRPVPRLRPWAPRVAAIGMVAVGAALATRTWLRGFSGLDRVAQEHDMVTHQVLVAYMMRTGRMAPWQIQPSDLLSGQPVSTYPGGGHLAPALLAGFGAEPVAALNAFTIVYLAVCWVFGSAVLGVVAARRIGTGRTTSWLVGGVAAVVAPALYRPPFQLMHDGGIYPNAVALALTPGLLAGFLLAWRERSRLGTGAALGLGSAGLVAVHPSAAMTVGLSLLAWAVGDLVHRPTRATLYRTLPVLGGTAAVAVLAGLPLVLSSTASVGGVAAFPPDSPPSGFADALGSAIGLGYGGYLDEGHRIGQAGLTVLCLAGVAAAVRAGRGLGLVTAWAAWVGVTFAAMLSPGTGAEAPVTGFFYHAMVRIWAHVSIFVPALAALAVVLAVAVVVRAVRRALPVVLRGPTVLAVAVLACAAGLVVVPVRTAVATNTAAVASRYAEPEFVRVGPEDLAAVEFLRDRVAPGERVMNSANDGSTFLYVGAGIPVVSTATLGTATTGWSIPLQRGFRDYPQDPSIRGMLRDLDVGWVYVDTAAPGIGAAGAPYNWVDPTVPFTVPPGLQDLDERPLPGLTKEFTDGTVSVYRLDLDRIDQPVG
ncbi:DUF6541 family protein [Pseudonocardia sp. HH130630-07]|uniref:DUF6541 family protein n=1 Tax=Pseudonocardia sp. HH130630-07 TaxID=1690815 RepID=UPI000814B725|nr:DUF6541 family protein [Pseudonocardia sp. HH130630-07]ANY06669.1 hypothetical protein AFB00_10600 [Pseudonocardia sp. HH130630-07]